MKPVRFLRPAELEMLDAAQYYEMQAPGLGADFLDKIDEIVVEATMHLHRRPDYWRDR